MHCAFRTGFEKRAFAKQADSPVLHPYHAPADSAPPEQYERTAVNLTPDMGTTVRNLTSRVAGKGAGAILKTLHVPRELAFAAAVPHMIESRLPRSDGVEHSAAPIQQHDGVM